MMRIFPVVLMILLLAGTLRADSSGRLYFVGEVPAPEQLSRHGSEAYAFAKSHFDAEYISFDDLLSGAAALPSNGAVWWHQAHRIAFPPAAVRSGTIDAFRRFMEEGGGLFLSGFAVSYVVELGLEENPPSTVEFDPKIAEEWGYRAKDPLHPIFENLPSVVYTTSEGLRVDNAIAWWDDPGQFGGTWLADVEWGGGKMALGEYSRGRGKAVVTGAGAFCWGARGRQNANRGSLETLTANILRYLGAQEIVPMKPASSPAEVLAELTASGGTVGVLVSGDTMSEEERVIAEWLGDAAVLLSAVDLGAGSAVPGGVKVLWVHHADTPELPGGLRNPAFLEAVGERLYNGTGLLLTGFATQLAVSLGLEEQPPTSVFLEPGSSGNWGFRPLRGDHPLFDGLASPVHVLSEGIPVRNAISWWDNPREFSGTWLADNEAGYGKVAVGEYRHGRGRALVVGSGAFDWSISSGQNRHRDQLERFAANTLVYLARATESLEPGLAAWWTFDGVGGQHVVEQVSGRTSRIHSIQETPDMREGPTGGALRLDGYTVWVEHEGGCAPRPDDAMTVSAWVAVDAHPAEPASIAGQFNETDGWVLGITRTGEWGLRAKIGDVWHAIWAPESFPLQQWVHVAARFDRAEGLALFLNGERVAQQASLNEPLRPATGEPLLLGCSNRETYVVDLFRTGVLKGLLGDVRVYTRALGAEEISEQFAGAGAVPIPDIWTPPSRFAHDPHRPIFHPMPIESWTNEPHGLVQTGDGTYHMFYQKNPSGPYWAYIHWGYLSSRDLVHWTNHPPALAPGPGRDREGVWSGDAVVHDGELTLVYSGVDGIRAAMMLAVEDAESPTGFRKVETPAISGRPAGERLLDFRDPYLWREDGGWHMVVGAGIPDTGGTALYFRSQDLRDWSYHGHYFSGSIDETGFFWEMPVYIPFGDIAWFGVTEMPGRNSWWTGRREGDRFIPADPRPTRLEIINHYLSPTVTTDDRGRVIAIGIIPETRSSEEQHAAGWAHVYGIPRVWSMTGDGLFTQHPLPELQTLRGGHAAREELPLQDGRTVALDGIEGDAMELLVEIDPQDADEVSLMFRRSPGGEEQTTLTYRFDQSEFVLDRTRSSTNVEVQRDVRRGPFQLEPGENLKLHLFLDKSVVELFANGRGTLTTRVYPTRADSLGIALESKGGNAMVRRVDAWQMNPAPVRGPREQ